MPPLKPHLYNSAVRLLVLDPFVYQTRLFLISGWNPFCHSHLSWNLTVNNLWYSYFRVILTLPVGWVHPQVSRFFGMTEVCGFWFPLEPANQYILSQYQLVDPSVKLLVSISNIWGTKEDGYRGRRL